MAGRFDFQNIGAAAATSLSDFLVQRETARRQQIMDAMRQASFGAEQAERARQAERLQQQDLIAADQRAEARMRDERDFNARQEQQRVENSRHEAEQKQREADRKDAAANRYLDVERGYYEDAQKQQFDATEAAKDRASQERRTAMGSESRKPTQGQLTADTFANRAQDALDTVEAVEGNISAWDLVAHSSLQSEAGQTYGQAKQQFIEAYLRKDSGAAIGKDEYRNADKTYFPQLGDRAETLKRKRDARRKIVESLRTQGTGNSNSGGGSTGKSRYRVTVE